MSIQAKQYREYLILMMCWLSEMLLSAPCRTGQVLITVIDMKMKLNPPKQKSIEYLQTYTKEQIYTNVTDVAHHYAKKKKNLKQ